LPWDIFIYLVFFLALATLLFIPDKNLQPSLLMTVVVLATIVDKVRNAGDLPVPGLDDRGFATLIIHIGMFTLPLLSAGLIRGRGKHDKRAIAPSILTGIIAGVYFIWFQISFNPMGQTPL
jgi:hypothetical protein